VNDENNRDWAKPPNSVLVSVERGEASESLLRFNDTFLIEYHGDCDLQIKDTSVGGKHAQILFDLERWWVKDLESANGTCLCGQSKIQGE